jgi:hypothetical protein
VTKYAPLTAFLANSHADEIPLGFTDIERIIRDKLPGSAEKFAQWWSNNPKNNVMTRAWLEAGYKSSQIDIKGRRLVFRKASSISRPEAPASLDDPLAGLYGCMEGTVRFLHDVDLTAPTGERWAAEEE